MDGISETFSISMIKSIRNPSDMYREGVDINCCGIDFKYNRGMVYRTIAFCIFKCDMWL